MGSYLDWPPDKFDEQRDADGRIWDEPVVCVYVPHERSFLRRSIRRGSGIVSLPLERGNIEIDFEGNLDGDADLARYVARVARAWDRQSRRSPTIARLRIDAEELLQVGWYETETGLVHVKEWKRLPEAPRILTEWLGLETLPATELGADEENDQAPARRREGMPGLIRRRRKLPPQVSDDPYSLRWGPDSYLDHRPDFKNAGRYWVPSETPFWVPHERSFLRRAIEQGAGIVGHRYAGGPSRGGMIRIYWVGKHSAAGAPVTFADRVVRAWHLMEVSYPTTCRLAVDEGDLEPVGLYDTRTGELQVKEWSNQPDAPELLAAWLGVDELPDEELRLSAVAVRSPFAEDDD